MNSIARVMRANSRLSTKPSVEVLPFISMARILRMRTKSRDPLLAQRAEQGIEQCVAQIHAAIRQRHDGQLRGGHDPEGSAMLGAQVPDFDVPAFEALDLQTELWIRTRPLEHFLHPARGQYA